MIWALYTHHVGELHDHDGAHDVCYMKCVRDYHDVAHDGATDRPTTIDLAEP